MGTKEGGYKARDTNKKRYGKDYYIKMGAEGGKKSGGTGFAYDRGDGLTPTERAKRAAAKRWQK